MNNYVILSNKIINKLTVIIVLLLGPELFILLYLI